MQEHACTNCKKNSIGGGSIVYGGMFFKMCPECLEDEEVIRNMNEYWRNFEGDQEETTTQIEETTDEVVENP